MDTNYNKKKSISKNAVVPAGKARDNIVLVCKSHYINYMVK